MPLVIFNYFYNDLLADVNALSGIEKEVTHKRTLELPWSATQATWKLVAVNANFINDKTTDWISMDVKIPELMTSEHVLYSNVTVGDTEAPKEGFRFYTQLRQLSERKITGLLFRETSCYNVISEYPNWNLGETRLEKPSITCEITPHMGNIGDDHKAIQLNGVSIILSYEQ